AVILAGVGIGIQTMMPVTTSPATLVQQDLSSQTAAVGGTLAQTDEGSGGDVTQVKATVERLTKRVGYDQFTISGGPLGTDPNEGYWPVCPQDKPMTKTDLDSYWTTARSLGTLVKDTVGNSKETYFGRDNEGSTRRCQPDPTNSANLIPS